ncbi:MAG: glycosyltransferase family 2 protein [Candidatus Phytoplasma sp.]|nr:glycosyltransferase family 2 protein [Phytoplasma sp.]
MEEIISFILEYIRNNLPHVIFGLLTLYQVFYLITGVFSKKKSYPETNIFKKYAVVIAARNEEAVIGKLIESINKQTYDKDKIQVFVVADNCSDNTAKIARAHGAIVYERFNEEKKRKGWALQYLFDNINKDYDILSFDGYIFFDADNLVDKNFIHEINKAFVVNKNIVVSYRNVKNFDTNFISSAYGIHFFRSVVSYHRPRERFNLGTHVAGTGYVVSAHLIKDGWNFHSLTEDTELTLHFSTKGVKIGFCEDAVFYDEQPIDFATAYRQRLRWTAGRAYVFIKYLPSMIFNMFRKLSFNLYDMFFYSFPYAFYSLAKFIFIPMLVAVITGNFLTGNFWYEWLIIFVTFMSSVYLGSVFFASLVVIRERKNIKAKKGTIIKAVITFPWFEMINILLAFGVLINPKIKWSTIAHTDQRTIDEIDKSGKN